MSEYEYYEFVAVDRPLSEREQRELRAISSRATITSTCFANSYSYGSLKADPAKLVESYFDAHLYLANWGTRALTLRLPARLVDLALAHRCCGEHHAVVRRKGEHVILELWSDDESSDWVQEDEGPGMLAALLPLRGELAAGDHRALYLGWLLRVQEGSVDDSEEEPPCPPGLRSLSAPLEALVEFLRIDRDLVAAAATRSSASCDVARADLERWVGSLPDDEQTALLAQFVEGSDPHLRSELLRFHALERAPGADPTAPRTVAQLVTDADRLREDRERIAAEGVAKERARREREAAEARSRDLDALERREPAAWAQVDALIATKQPRRYDEAVKLLRDLRDLGARRGDAAAIEDRIRRVCEEHANKPSFLRRLAPPAQRREALRHR